MTHFMKLPTMTVQRLVTLAMLVALAIVVGKFSIPIIPQQLVVSFVFIVNTVIGMIAGPLWAFLSFALIDVVDNLTSGSSNFIIWWTLMEATQGFFYGWFFYHKPLSINRKKDWLYVSVATVLIMLIGTFIFTPLLIQIYYHVPFWAQFAAGRWLKIFEIPIRVLVTMLVVPALQNIPEVKKLSDLN
ncbi:folate family ECF transporter S component [Streptococcus halichoeri]|uniref:folate family ECF transporter S component n=1 Tax=Streptococcus halichoeri TaxID=254785 RepID=UPI0013599DED|nr:folate family ECF transporter S component [Streptococcus halichoeri]